MADNTFGININVTSSEALEPGQWMLVSEQAMRGLNGALASGLIAASEKFAPPLIRCACCGRVKNTAGKLCCWDVRCSVCGKGPKDKRQGPAVAYMDDRDIMRSFATTLCCDGTRRHTPGRIIELED